MTTARPAEQARAWRPSDAVDRQALARAYQQGASLRACGIRFGFSAPVIARLLREEHIEIRPVHGRRVRADVTELARAYRAGHSLIECAAAAGISAPTAARLLHAAGVTLRPPHRRRTEVDLAALALAYQSLSLADCAVKFGVSARVIRRLLIAQGIPIRPSGIHITPPTTDAAMTTNLHQPPNSYSKTALQRQPQALSSIAGPNS